MRKLLVCVISVASISAGCDSRHQKTSLPRVAASLDKTVSSINGYTWPIHTDGSLFAICAMSNPSILSLEVSGKVSFEIHAKSVVFHQDEGRLSGVHVTTPQELVKFPEAVNEVQRIADALKLEGQSPIRESVKEWRNWPTEPGFERIIATGAKLNDQVNLRLEIKRHVSGGGWFVLTEFEMIK